MVDQIALQQKQGAPGRRQLMLIRPMTRSDIPALAAFAERVWQHHYPAIIPQEQIDYMVGHMYEPEKLKQEMEKGVVFLVAEDDGALCGYIAYERMQEAGEYFIHKFYVAPERHRQGIGGRLLEAMLARVPDATVLELCTHRRNAQAIAFYARQGFAPYREVDRPFGPYVMEDFQLRRVLHG